METPPSRPTSPPPPDTNHLDVSRDIAEGTPTDDQPLAQAAARVSDVGDAEDPLEQLFTDYLLHALFHALPSAGADTEEQKHRHRAAAVHLLRSFDTQQPLEAALATQAVLAHHAALAAYRRAAAPGQFSDITSRETGSAARMSTQFRFLLRELDHRQDHPAHPPKSEHKR